MFRGNIFCYLLVIFLLLLVSKETVCQGITPHSVTKCSNNINISCNNTGMIHVERITIYNGTDCNQAVADLQVCGQPLTGSDTGLSPSCNRKQSCNEVIYNSYCPGSKAAKVDYRCIPRNDVTDMCQEIIIDHTNRTFLSTPNYPFSATFTDIISPCRCSIRGSSITSIQMLELVLPTSGDGTKSSLEINYGDGTYKAESLNGSTRRVYNKRLSTTSTTAKIVLNHNNINTQFLWIELQGVALHVACNSMTTSASPTKPPTTTTETSPVTLTSPSSSPSSPSPSSSSSSSPSSLPSSSTSLQSSTEQQRSTESAKSSTSKTKEDNIPIIAGSTVGGVVLIVVIIIIIFLVCRKRATSSYDKPLPPQKKDDNYLPLRFRDKAEMTSSTGEINEAADTRNPESEIQYVQIDTQATYGQVGGGRDVIPEGQSSMSQDTSRDVENAVVNNSHILKQPELPIDGTNQAVSDVEYSTVNKPKIPRKPEIIIDENALYVPLEITKPEKPKKSDIIIDDNELYVPLEMTKPQKPIQKKDIIIDENELYIPLELTKPQKPNDSGAIIDENVLYTPFEETVRNGNL